MGDHIVTAREDLRNNDVLTNTPFTMNPATWMTVASLVDDDNWWFDFDSPDDSGGKFSGAAENWMKLTGLYKKIVNETSIGNLRSKSLDHFLDLNDLFGDDGSRSDIIVTIDAKLLPGGANGMHVAALMSSIEFDGKMVRFACWMWGGDEIVEVERAAFEDNYYGYLVGVMW